jgi:hypothetical protein
MIERPVVCPSLIAERALEQMTSDLESMNKSRIVVLMAKLGQTSFPRVCLIAEDVLAEKPVEKVPSVEESTKSDPSLYIPLLEEPAL